MKPLSPSDISIDTERSGLFQPTKGSFPARYGERTVIETPELLLELDAAGRLKYLTGRGRDWPDPLEYLKRTDGDDWVYYSLGEYADHLGLYGEHYLPCPDYPTNRPLGGEPFRRPGVQRALADWPETLRAIRAERDRLPREHHDLVERLEVSEPPRLARHAERLHEVIGSAVPVLPPDARHVDYDVVPIIVADGCRYGCPFCRVKDGRAFAPRSRKEIRAQLEGLRGWLGRQLGNVQGLFVGLHDALAADESLLCWSIEDAHRRLGFEGSPFARPHLYLFGSVDSLLAASDRLFDWLSRCPFATFVNVGLESADGETLERLGKPVTAERVGAAFERVVEINARWPAIEVTTNFLLFPEPGASDEAMLQLIARSVSRRTTRGVCYLSPLMRGSARPRSSRRALLARLHRLQRASLVPLHLYLIQRL